MANRVNLTKRIETAPGLWRYCPVVESANGRVKPDVVSIAGHEERHPEGAYYIEWRENGKRVRLSVGKHAADAAAARQRKEAELVAVANGVAVAPPANDTGSLRAAVVDYLDEVKLTKKPKTHVAYSHALGQFLESCSKPTVAALERRDLLKFAAYMRDELELSPRTCNVRFGYLMIFLKAQNVRGLAKKGDWPSYTLEEPEIYEPEDLEKLFAACTPEERLWYDFFLCTGMREQEVMYCYWSDINFAAPTVRVTHKPDRGWTPKAYKEREIPIPTRLAAALKARKAKADKGCNLVFPTSGCNPKLDFLDCLKAIAVRAKLEKENFWLHKFRATFATRCLWASVDLRTVQQWLGHSDMESTMRYLKPSRSKEVRAKVNEIFA
jgi:integrase